jgi:hypothetical protein
VITTGDAPLLVTCHVTVVSLFVGSHEAFPARTTDEGSGAGGGSVVVGATVAGTVVGAAVVDAAVVGAAVVCGATVVVGAAVVGVVVGGVVDGAGPFGGAVASADPDSDNKATVAASNTENR